MPVFNGLKTHIHICPCKHTGNPYRPQIWGALVRERENHKKAWCTWIGRAGAEGTGLIASVCDRRAHSILFNPSNNPVGLVVLSSFCKGRRILEKIMNLSQWSQESNHDLQEFSVLWRSGMDRRVRALFSFRGTCSSHAALGQLCSQVLWSQITNLPLS